MFKTFRYRVKDRNIAKSLLEKSFAVNFVWNYCNETQKHALKWRKRWPSTFDLQKLTAGSSKELGLSSTTIQTICDEYATRRTQFKKPYLQWRSKKKSLPWIPFKANAIGFNRETGVAKYSNLTFKTWYSRPLEGTLKTGSICADSRGRFYLNLVCEVKEAKKIKVFPKKKQVGIDLGLKDLASFSDGHKVNTQRYFRKQERRIALAQSKGKSKLVRKLHAKVKNQRVDFNHKLSNKITNEYDLIVVGNVSSRAIIEKATAEGKKGVSKSVNDAGWYQLKSFLTYKALAKGKTYLEVNEAYSTQTCSKCRVISTSSPKGTQGLSVRQWECSSCRALHDRDINAARNILKFGHELLQKRLS